MPRKAEQVESPAVEPVRIGGRIVSYRPVPETPAAPAGEQQADVSASEKKEA